MRFSTESAQYQPAFSPASLKCGEEVRERSRWRSDSGCVSPSQTCSITSSSVSRARCGNGLSRSSSPSMFHWVQFWTVPLRCLSAAQKRLVASTAVRLLKRAEPAGARAGESPAGSFGLTRLGLFQQSMPPLLVPADCGTIPLRTACTTHHADLSCRLPGELLDALGARPTLQTP